MSFSLLVQRKERLVALQRSEKETTPREKPFPSFTSCFSGIPVLRSNTAPVLRSNTTKDEKDEAELTCFQHAKTIALTARSNSRNSFSVKLSLTQDFSKGKWQLMSLSLLYLTPLLIKWSFFVNNSNWFVIQKVILQNVPKFS